MRSRTTMWLVLLACAMAPGLAVASPQASQGPLVLTPIKSSLVIVPDFKITKVNGTRSTLIGAYGGKVTEDTLLVGAGGYWLADPRDNAHLGYGGFVMGWRVLGTEHFSLGVKGLVGFGQATLPGTNLNFLVPPPFRDPRGHDVGPRTPGQLNRRFELRDDFFIAEPEASLRVRLTDSLRISLGAGYRVTSGSDYFERRLRGATGSVGLEFDFAR